MEVAHCLEAELAAHGLLLPPEQLAAVEAAAEELGAGLLTEVVHRCYPDLPRDGRVAIEVGGPGGAARIHASLAFGAATAHVLAPGLEEPERELVCALFNLGVGLVDAICDSDASTGVELLELVRRHMTVEASPRGWLRGPAPPAFARNPTVAFTVELLEALFAALHHAYGADLRRRLGAKLEAALEAELCSVVRPLHAQLLECSRLTSVLPFEIIELLACGERTDASTQLGEAMWRIDDLVDLEQDARSGALNGILLAGPPDSETIASAAREAAAQLAAGLRRAGGHARAAFLAFVQRYAGVTSLRSTPA